MTSPWFSFERTHYVTRDPPSVEGTRLRTNALSRHETLEFGRVESHVALDGSKGICGLRIAPTHDGS
jgi:hypothetical protein